MSGRDDGRLFGLVECRVCGRKGVGGLCSTCRTLGHEAPSLFDLADGDVDTLDQWAEDVRAEQHTDHSDRRVCQMIGCLYGDH